MSWMAGSSHGLHTALGVAASRVSPISGLRYCPLCVTNQIFTCGEPYWQRIHQAPGLTLCCQHYCQLQSLNTTELNTGRHEFLAAEPLLLRADIAFNLDKTEQRLSRSIRELLDRPEAVSQGFSQWTTYYHYLLGQANCLKGQYVNFDAVLDRVANIWPQSWLIRNNLWPLDVSNSWLRMITRKHRTSFSYLEHVVCLDALIDSSWTMSEVLDEVATTKPQIRTIAKRSTEPELASKSRNHKANWLKVVKASGTKLARVGAGAIYAWLYKNEREWLLKINARYRVLNYRNNRVNWGARDRVMVRKLIGIRNQSETNLELPRMSKLWFLKRLDKSVTVEKNLYRLPLTRMFLEQYQESITEYQIRRYTRELLSLGNQNLPQWILMRKAGLSEERLTAISKSFISEQCKPEMSQF